MVQFESQANIMFAAQTFKVSYKCTKYQNMHTALLRMMSVMFLSEVFRKVKRRSVESRTV